MTAAPQRTDSDLIQSASVTAMMRALFSEQTGTLRNPDYLAKHFVSSPWSDYLNDAEKSVKALEERVPGCVFYHLIRTKHFDSALKKWLDSHKNGQVLILGSGFDSRSIRFKEELKNYQVYEMDLPAMVRYKKTIIEGIPQSIKDIDNTTYIGINFHIDILKEKLLTAGFDFRKDTLILWEGVTYFLEESTVKHNLIELGNAISGDLTIMLDYALNDYIDGNLDYYGAPQLFEELKQIGEPHLFGIDPNEISCFFSALGYEVKNNHSSKELDALYLKDNQNNVLGRSPEFHGMVEITKSNAL